MSEETSESGGLMASAKRLLTTGVALLQNRIEIFSLELEEEKCRLVEVLLWASAAVLLGALAIIVISFTVVGLVWDNPMLRLVALILMALLYTGGAIFAAWQLSKRIKGSGKPFADTLDALKKDLSCLNTRE